MESTEKVKIKLSGMTCANCAYKIETKLKGLDGVNSSVVNFANEEATVEFNPNTTNYNNFNKAIRDLGYKWLQPDYQEPHRTLAACQEEQTASDSMFDGRYNGAFTWAFLKSLKMGEARTWLQVMEDAQKLLKTEGFSQVPIIRAQPKAINTYPLH